MTKTIYDERLAGFIKSMLDKYGKFNRQSIFVYRPNMDAVREARTFLKANKMDFAENEYGQMDIKDKYIGETGTEM